MNETTAVVLHEEPGIELGTVRAASPSQLVTAATAAANELAGVIERQKLFNHIQGKRYVRVEGWTTLAAMLGVMPREVTVTRAEDGTYTAVMELVRLSDGAVLTRASAECGGREKPWDTRPDYARRSMALTRATSKAARLAFSWVMALAGFEVTPAEEVPEGGFEHHEAPAPKRSRHVDTMPAAIAEIMDLEAEPEPEPAPVAGPPSCPVCHGAMWDNRADKRNPRAPDFKCKDKGCDGVIWPPKK